MNVDSLFPPILSAAQFSRDDVLKVTGISSGVLKGMLDRKQVTLRDDHNPGTGRRRLFTGGDILKIETAKTANAIGFPLRWAYLLADRVEQRATGKVTGTALEDCKHFAMAFYPNDAGDDWAFLPILDGKEASPLPIGRLVIDVDRLIDETIAKLQAVIDDQEVPSFKIPEVKSPNPYGPEEDFFRRWAKDEQGRDVHVGLSFDETQELLSLQKLWVLDRTQGEESSEVLMSRDQEERYRDLMNKHNVAHQKVKYIPK